MIKKNGTNEVVEVGSITSIIRYKPAPGALILPVEEPALVAVGA